MGRGHREGQGSSIRVGWVNWSLGLPGGRAAGGLGGAMSVVTRRTELLVFGGCSGRDHVEGCFRIECGSGSS